MRPIEGWDLINEAGELKRLPASAQLCRIIEATDIPEKDYLDIYFDIVEGEFKGYFATLQSNTGKNYGRIARSYKTNAMPFFKAAITAVEKSNPGYKWNWDEKTLNGKLCVVVFRDEEYMVDGQIKVMAKPDEIRSIQALRAGEIQIKPLKKYEGSVESYVAPEPTKLLDDDLPF